MGSVQLVGGAAFVAMGFECEAHNWTVEQLYMVYVFIMLLCLIL